MVRRLRLACLLTACASLLAAPGCGADSSSTSSSARAQAQIERDRERTTAEQARRRAASTTPTDAPASAPAAAKSTSILSASDRKSFSALARRLGGQSSIAVSPLGKDRRVETAGPARDVVAWSTSKVPIAMAIVAAGKADAEQADLTQAITASDNDAAQRLWDALGGGEQAASAADAQLRAAGDQTTQMQPKVLRDGFTAFGQTAWSVADQARFTAGMSCVDAAKPVLALMRRTIDAQRWGLGTIDPKARIKGGWGPGAQPGQDGGYIDRQIGIVTIGSRRLAVALYTAPSDGSHETGTQHLSALARWLKSHADTRRLGTTPAC